MKPSGRIKGVPSIVLLSLLAAAAVFGRAPLERTLFKDMPPNDPAREVIQTVLASTFYSMRDGFVGREWTDAGYGRAWERAKRYFPAQTYFVRPGIYFMTHGFDTDGRLFMEIHESAYLALCVENRLTFRPGSVVGEYGRMLASPDGRKAAAFREKTGRLEPFFLNETDHRGLRKSLGEELYFRLLKELREEDYHMLAGGLMHEGMHAGLDDALVARIQAEFGAGKRSVQWDELRAFMAEIGYHGPYSRWAAADVAREWRRIEGLLGQLERLRKTPRLSAAADMARLENVKTRIWAFAALIRLRMREIWQSARRMQGLAEGFRSDYIRGTLPPDSEVLFTTLDRDTADFVASAGEAIQASELAVQQLEQVLDEWAEWAGNRRPFPPPVTDSQAIARRVGDIHWPDPAGGAAAALMKRAGEEIKRERTSA